MNCHKQQGIQLVELLIALAIASLIMLGATKAYMASFKAQNSQSDSMRLNETGRFAFDLLTREIRKAGFSNTWQSVSGQRFCASKTDLTHAGPALAGFNDPLSPPASITKYDLAAATLGTTGTNGTSVAIANHADMIRVRYFGESTAGTAPTRDCQGNDIAAGTLVQDTLFIGFDAANNGEPTLYCRTDNPAATTATVPLVSGVESMQILYGVDMDEDGTIDQYVPWHLLPSGATSYGTLAPDLISSIKVSIVVRSPNDVAPVAQARTFNHFGTTAYPTATKAATANNDLGATFTVATADKRLRTILETEIALRNFPYCGST